MKKTMIFIFIFLFFIFVGNVSAMNYNNYSIDEIGISLNIPSDYYIFTRNITENDSNLTKFEMTKDDMIAYLNGLSAYMVATTEDTNYTIYVVMNENEHTKSYYDLKEVSEEIITGLGEGYTTGTGIFGDNVNKYDIHENNQALYIKFQYELEDIYDEYSYNLKYKTMKNGREYTIYLRKLAPINEDDKEMMKGIIDSVKYQESTETSSNNNVIMNIIGGLLFIGFIVMFFIKPKSKNKTMIK